MLAGCRASSRAALRHFRSQYTPIRVPRPARRFSTSQSSSGAAVPAPGKASLASLSGITSDLDRFAPRFDVNVSQIQILQDPSDFYQALKGKILRAKTRIYLSTLYIGKTEHELISVIREALQKNPTLRVSFLTDALRGTRETPEPSCASLLAPLVAEFGHERVEIRLFHTPNLTGIRKRILPKRINEGWGLQHMKLYGVDEELIMSGANLSNDYFTNRQDRYHVFSSKELTNYYARIHDAVCSISFLVQPERPDDVEAPAAVSYTLMWPNSNKSPSPLVDSKAYIKAATDLLQPLIAAPPDPSPPAATTTTSIYPLFQLTPLITAPDKVSTELPALLHLLTSLSPSSPHKRLHNSSWTFTAGYFNPHPKLPPLLLASHPASATVITAHPHANGFHGSKGISGMLPPAYTLLSRRFVDAVASAGQSHSIQLKEWQRGMVGQPGGWTYHAKGIWITLAEDRGAGPCISLVGSSNYTKRSYGLDLEANALIVTRDEGLMRRLGDEERWLQEYATQVGKDEFSRTERRVSLKVRLAMAMVSLLGGAL